MDQEGRVFGTVASLSDTFLRNRCIGVPKGPTRDFRKSPGVPKPARGPVPSLPHRNSVCCHPSAGFKRVLPGRLDEIFRRGSGLGKSAVKRGKFKSQDGHGGDGGGQLGGHGEGEMVRGLGGWDTVRGDSTSALFRPENRVDTVLSLVKKNWFPPPPPKTGFQSRGRELAGRFAARRG